MLLLCFIYFDQFYCIIIHVVSYSRFHVAVVGIIETTFYLMGMVRVEMTEPG